MARKTKYSLDEFRSLIVAGKTKAEIMQQMDIKNHPTFSNLMIKLMDEDKKYYQVKQTRKARKAKPPVVKVGKNNTLTLSAKMLASTSFKPGDSFQLKTAKNRISLVLVEE